MRRSLLPASHQLALHIRDRGYHPRARWLVWLSFALLYPGRARWLAWRWTEATA